jgi:phytoene dehydrogenase-like protein
MSIDREWDVICIGAGITSLAFGAQLVYRRPGTRVLIVEKHSIPGGYATWFRRPKEGARFDCSLHKLSGMGAGGNLKRIFQTLGLDTKLKLIYPPHFFRQCFSDHEIVLENEISGIKACLIQEYPSERAGLETFFSDVNIHGRVGYYQYQMMAGEYDVDFSQLRYAHRNLKKITLSNKFSQLFKNDRLKEILSNPGVYVGMFPEQMSYLYYLHVIFATLNAGNAYVIGSGQHLSNCLAEMIATGGGKVMLSTAVRRVLVDNTATAVGVETKHGSFYAPQVYVNAAPKYAVNELFPAMERLDPIKAKLQALGSASSLTTLYLLTDAPPAELGIDVAENMLAGRGHDEALRLRQQARSDTSIVEEAYWQAGPMEVTNYHALDPAGGHAVVANVLDILAHWPDRKAPEYKEKKSRAKATLLARLCAAFPALVGQIKYAEMSTPRTYLRFTNNTDGSGFGALVGTDLLPFTFHHAFPIKGISFLSSWVAGPGYEAAFGYAELRAKQWAGSVSHARRDVA